MNAMNIFNHALLMALDDCRPGCCTLDELRYRLAREKIEYTEGHIRTHLILLVKSGFVEMVQQGCWRTTRVWHDLNKKGGVMAPKNGIAARGIAARVWWVIRRQGTRLTVEGLLGAVANADEVAARESVTRYVRYLIQAGYLQGSAQTSCRLVRNSGPLPPVVRRCLGKPYCLYDGNTGDLHILQHDESEGVVADAPMAAAQEVAHG
jgi:hypothetical protein